MNIFSEKLKTVFFSILPIFLIVFVFHFFVYNLPNKLLFSFVLSSILLIIGLTIFLVGVDIGIKPFGNVTGSSIAKKNKLYLIIVFGIILGFMISIAEPSLIVLTNQLKIASSGQISSFIFISTVSIGFAIMMVIGLIRIIYNIPLHIILIVSYLIIFILAIFSDFSFIAMAFDASGTTTGVLSVPFILALGRGITKLKKDSKSSEKDSFGLISITSIGPILSILILGLILKSKNLNFDKIIENENNYKLINIIKDTFIECLIIIIPLILIFIFMNKVYFKLNKKQIKKFIFGFIFSFVGLFLFLIGASSGFMETGYLIGNQLSMFDNSFYLVLFAFFIGFFTILAEPGTYVLVEQIEEVTSGYINKKALLISLCLGVGIAILLSVIRLIYPSVELWHFLLPGYLIAILLTFFSPKLFVAISFDSGGVATGPMTTTFIFAFITGITASLSDTSSLMDSFGMISLVALFPIITIQILGLVFKYKGVDSK